MLWPSRIFTICTLCWCALCFVSLSLLWQLQWFGLMQGCFTKFYLPLLTMNWTTHSIWHSFPYQHSHGNQGKHRTLSSTHCWQSGTSSGALQIFFGGRTTTLDHASEVLSVFVSMLQINNWIEHLKSFILLTHLSGAVGLSVGAHTTPLMKAYVVQTTLENLRVFSVSRHKILWLVLFCGTSVSIWHGILYWESPKN